MQLLIFYFPLCYYFFVCMQLKENATFHLAKAAHKKAITEFCTESIVAIIASVTEPQRECDYRLTPVQLLSLL